MLHRLAARALPRASRSLVAAGRRAAVVPHARPAAAVGLSSAARAFSAAPERKISNPEMVCRQCEQTQDGEMCTTVGVCGKTAETSVSMFRDMFVRKM